MSGSVPAFRLAGGGGGSKKPISIVRVARATLTSHEMHRTTNEVSEVGEVQNVVRDETDMKVWFLLSVNCTVTDRPTAGKLSVLTWSLCSHVFIQR